MNPVYQQKKIQGPVYAIKTERDKDNDEYIIYIVKIKRVWQKLNLKTCIKVNKKEYKTVLDNKYELRKYIKKLLSNIYKVNKTLFKRVQIIYTIENHSLSENVTESFKKRVDL